MFTEFLLDLPPYMFAALGISASVAFSILGAATGIYITGSTLVAAAIRVPKIYSLNLISILFCEAAAIYGLVMAIILGIKWQRYTELTDDDYFSGYVVFTAGTIVGLCNLFCGIAVGVTGASTALAHAQNQTLFSKIIIVELFASALGLFGLILGFILSSKIEWSG
eukprot:TRINITY_DN41338_c0_g1_i2.p1 TRINITY_DN41338_c0_g1~~TRINITY_DN41338_c0_g1_i2.p1  ORF type:complete len:166 (-),score=14.51 TRINITY_DN41338_c0_g1_i2:18-515(-)